MSLGRNLGRQALLGGVAVIFGGPGTQERRATQNRCADTAAPSFELTANFRELCRKSAGTEDLMDCFDDPCPLLRSVSPGKAMDFPTSEFEVDVTGAVGVEGVKVEFPAIEFEGNAPLRPRQVNDVFPTTSDNAKVHNWRWEAGVGNRLEDLALQFAGDET